MLFAVLGSLAGLFWLLFVIEWIGTLRLSPWAFRFGPVVIRETYSLSLPLDSCRARSGDETARADWRLVGPTFCLFRFRVRLLGPTLHTPFLVKGAIQGQEVTPRQGAPAQVVGRLPLFPLLFLLVWLIGCTAGGIMMVIDGQPLGVSIALLAIGWLFPPAICLASIPYEIGRARDALEELKEAPECSTSTNLP